MNKENTAKNILKCILEHTYMNKENTAKNILKCILEHTYMNKENTAKKQLINNVYWSIPE